MDINIYLKIVLTSLASIAVLFILTKIMGKRQMSQLSMFDYINGITIGSIAADAAINIEGDMLRPIVAMIVYAAVSALISVMTCKSVKLRRFFVGKSLILYCNGELYKENFKKSKIDVNEFLVSMRNSGYFDLSELYACILEPNGKMSFMPLDSEKPVTAKEMGVSTGNTSFPANVIIDGNVMTKTLKNIGKDETWLKKMLDENNINSVSEVYLATADADNNFNVYTKETGKIKEDVWV